MSDQSGPDKRLELAYAAAQQKLSMQDATLSNIRTRANNLLATTALFIAFSAGVGLINTDPEKGAVFPTLAAVVLLIVVVALGISVLTPRFKALASADRTSTRSLEGCGRRPPGPVDHISRRGTLRAGV